MAIIKTIIKVPALDAVYNVPGSWDAAQIQSMYAQQIPGISSMVSTVTNSTTPEGEVREITFTARSGNKG
jgi:hypothetical protein